MLAPSPRELIARARAAVAAAHDAKADSSRHTTAVADSASTVAGPDTPLHDPPTGPSTPQGRRLWVRRDGAWGWSGGGSGLSSAASSGSLTGPGGVLAGPTGAGEGGVRGQDAKGKIGNDGDDDDDDQDLVLHHLARDAALFAQRVVFLEQQLMLITAENSALRASCFVRTTPPKPK
jgi:hypothetical protein